MADLAMLRLRMLFQSFIPLPEAFSAYEAAGGHPVDLDHVQFWQILFQTGFARRSRYDDPNAPPPPNLGMNQIYSTIHRKILSETLADAMNVNLRPITIPDAEKGPRARSFEIALDDLRHSIVPRISDQQASAKAKGLARLIKWWRDIERYEPLFLAEEKAEIENLLQHPFPNHAAAWAAFCDLIKANQLDAAMAIDICNAHVTRDAALMAGAMGGLANAVLAPLE